MELLPSLLCPVTSFLVDEPAASARVAQRAALKFSHTSTNVFSSSPLEATCTIALPYRGLAQRRSTCPARLALYNDDDDDDDDALMIT